MPTFTPPVVSDRPQVSEEARTKAANPVGYRLMRYFHPRARGVNVYKMSDGTFRRDDLTPGEPYPAVVPFDSTNASPSSFPNGNLAQSYYAGRRTDYPLAQPTVSTVYYGSHSYTVTSAEAAALTAAGFGANIT